MVLPPLQNDLAIKPALSEKREREIGYALTPSETLDTGKDSGRLFRSFKTATTIGRSCGIAYWRRPLPSSAISNLHCEGLNPAAATAAEAWSVADFRLNPLCRNICLFRRIRPLCAQ